MCNIVYSHAKFFSPEFKCVTVKFQSPVAQIRNQYNKNNLYYYDKLTINLKKTKLCSMLINIAATALLGLV